MTDELKPGQKFPTPTPGMGDRVFYETLLRQRPASEMAQEWYDRKSPTQSERSMFVQLCTTRPLHAYEYMQQRYV